MATGFSGTGLTWGTFAASRIAAGILGEQDEDDARFSPGRVALLGSADRVVEDQASVLWHMIADRLKPSGDLHPFDLQPGPGIVPATGAATARTERGSPDRRSATSIDASSDEPQQNRGKQAGAGERGGGANRPGDAGTDDKRSGSESAPKSGGRSSRDRTERKGDRQGANRKG